MSLLKDLSPDEQAHVNHYLEEVFIPAGTCIMKQGSPGDGCYLIDDGIVRLEINIEEIQSDSVLGYLEPGMWLGEFSLVDGEPRSANAYAETDVRTRFFSVDNFKELCAVHPQIGLTITTNLSLELTRKMRDMNERFANYIFTETSSPAIDEMVSNAAAAQKELQSWPEDRIDALINDIAEAIYEKAEELAEDTVMETKIGLASDKVIKITNMSKGLASYLAGKTGFGYLSIEGENGVKEIASPMGVVYGLIPITNPVPTIAFKTLICLKSRNALIFSCHRNSLQVGNKAGEIIKTVLRKHGAPDDLVQWIKDRASRIITAMVMSHKDISFILATGGSSLVKAAYSSGNPAIGVGPGNAPVLICKDADVKAVAEAVIFSKSFDNGLLCGSENNLVVNASLKNALIKSLEDNGAAVLKPEEKELFTATVIDPASGSIRLEAIGQSAEAIAGVVGINRSYPIKLIVIPVEEHELQGPYGKEKLAPILSMFFVNDEGEEMELCKRLLLNQGAGHIAIIHSHNDDIINRFGLEMPVSRIIVNYPGVAGCTGVMGGLVPSATLGCGTLGGSSTTDNVNYTNLLNIKRMTIGR